jgi:cytochrome P450
MKTPTTPNPGLFENLNVDSLNPISRSFLDAPSSYYPGLLAQPPVRLVGAAPCVVAARYADVVQMLRDHETFSSVLPDLPELAILDPFAGVGRMLFSDPPAHTSLRRSASIKCAFGRKSNAALELKLRATIKHLLARVGRNREFDVVDDLARPLHFATTTFLLGIPSHDQPRLSSWSNTIFTATRAYIDRASALFCPTSFETRGLGRSGFQTPASDAISSLREYFRTALRDKKKRSGLVGAVSEQSNQAKTLEEMVSMCILILFASETAVNLVAGCVYVFAQHKNEYERLRTDPRMTTSAVEEVLRYDSPVQMVLRFSKRQGSVGGTIIPCGTMILLLLGAANRDPAHFPDPNRFDIGRHPNDHLAFGSGAHACLGAKIARLQAVTAMTSIARRFRSLRLAETEGIDECRTGLLSRVFAGLRIAAE